MKPGVPPYSVSLVCSAYGIRCDNQCGINEKQSNLLYYNYCFSSHILLVRASFSMWGNARHHLSKRIFKLTIMACVTIACPPQPTYQCFSSTLCHIAYLSLCYLVVERRHVSPEAVWMTKIIIHPVSRGKLSRQKVKQCHVLTGARAGELCKM